MLGVVRHRIDSAARRLLDLVQYSSSASLQPAETKLIGTAARSKALVMLRRSCYSGLQLGVSKGIVNSCVEGSFWAPSILVLGGITAERGSCKVHFNSCVKRRIGVADRRGNWGSLEQGQRRSSLDKKLLK